MASMGSSLEIPSRADTDCPLCSGKCREPSFLPCGHCFCRACIQEVWSSSPTGPYYCPECREEYRKMPAFDRHGGGPPTAAMGTQGRGAFFSSDRSDGEMPSTSTSALLSNLTQRLGKRRAPSFSRTERRERGDPPPPPPPPSSTARAASAGPDGSVRCSYCASPGQQVAVKTCLVCGASMCATHLRHHLESPEFQAHPLVAPVADVTTWRCAEHQEAKKIYCRDCAACVCTVCTVIGAHRDHACVGVAEAEGQLRGSLRDDMKKMKENEEVIRSRVASLQEKEQNIQETLDRSRDSLRQQYQAMREALDRQELMALQVVDREERRVLGGVQAQLELLQEELRSIRTSLDTLEGLSNSKGAERVKGQAFIMEYSKISESVTAMSSPLGELEPLQEVDRARLLQLEEWAEKRLKALFLQATMDRDALRLLYGITPSLDPDTAHQKLVLSEGYTRVTHSDEPQPYPDQPARFSTFPQVLGARAREGGRSYWEVAVAGDGRWKVGVCDSLLGRKGAKDACRIGFNPHSWCLFGERGKMEALHNKESFPVEGGVPERVGVFLDMEKGILSFYAVPEGGALTLLHSFTQAFAQPLFPALAVSKMELAFCHLFQ
ncbi:tripartite motif-containing protein 14-like [Anguilla rostrata]|uniref:tripartite motif-containing protein 14-like n=1 Tax=Anguilla rostrata TaxID=7938 RepID=UPI0030D34DC4